MKKGKKIESNWGFLVLVVSVLIFSLLLSVLNLKFTGYSIGNLSFDLQGAGYWVNITSPENITYERSANYDGNYYPFYLNVTSNRNCENIWFTHIDKRLNNIMVTNLTIAQDTNYTEYLFNATRGTNYIIVYANDTGGNVRSDEVYFYVNLIDAEPVIMGLNDTYYICENHDIDFIYGPIHFTVQNYDENRLRMTDTFPNIYLSPEEFIEETTYVRLFSGVFDKPYLWGINVGSRTMEGRIEIDEIEGDQDSYENITLILLEVNNLAYLAQIPTQTVWSRGDDTQFDYTAFVNDVEDGDNYQGNLVFNITFKNNENIFNISWDGSMFFIANSSYLDNGNPKVYEIRVCVTDKGLSTHHENISLCSTETYLPLTNCDDFNLTVTNENRAPVITSYYPENLSLEIYGLNAAYVNLTAKDPDGVTIPSVYWYSGGIFQELDDLDSNNASEFFRILPCNTGGTTNITAVVSDGLLNTSITWNLTYMGVACDPGGGSGRTSASGGGRRSGRDTNKTNIFFCEELWAIDTWDLCIPLKDAFENKLIDMEKKIILESRCELRSWDKVFCGYQSRNISDFHFCGTNNSLPAYIRECYYTINPTCYDNIENCHDGNCEIAPDCGGPCDPCPSCKDGIANQEELGTDCGGPCKPCKVEVPIMARSITQIAFYIILPCIFILILIIIIILTVRFKRYEKVLQKELRSKYKKI